MSAKLSALNYEVNDMAYYNEDQLYRYFDKAISNESKKRIKDLETEIDYSYAKQMKKIKENLKIKKDLELNQALRTLKLEYHDKINKIGVGYDAKLIKEREKMTSLIFKEVIKELKAFVKSKEYQTKMKEKLVELNKYLGKNEVIIQIANHDTNLSQIIKESLKVAYKIEKTETINFGGFIACVKKKKIEIDETIDSKLAENKQWFFKNAKLFIKR